MRTKLRLLRWLMMLALSMSTMGAWAENQDFTQTVCIGNEPYRVDASALPNPTYHWSITPGNATNWQINGTGTIITVDWKTAGVYILSVYTSSNGCDGPTKQVTVTVSQNVNIAAFSPATSTRCQGAGTVTTTTTATNSTGITYSLDAVSLAGGNTIDVATGAVTYAAGWSGTTTITASAAGCNGPATTTITVTVDPLPTTSPIWHN